MDLWSVDAAIADDMLTVLGLVRESHRYPDDLGFRDEIAAVWRLWRGGQVAQSRKNWEPRTDTTQLPHGLHILVDKGCGYPRFSSLKHPHHILSSR